jgi:hypothetical protein
MDHKPINTTVLVYTTIGDEADSEGYNHLYRQLTVEAKIRLQWGVMKWL